MIIPHEYTNMFLSYHGQSLSQVIYGMAIIRNRRYDGYWYNWYIYTNSNWKPGRTHTYIDANWDGEMSVDRYTDEIETMIETE